MLFCKCKLKVNKCCFNDNNAKVETTLVFILEKQRMYRYLHVVHSLQMKPSLLLQRAVVSKRDERNSSVLITYFQSITSYFIVMCFEAKIQPLYISF